MEILDSEKTGVASCRFASKMDLLNQDEATDQATEMNMTEEEQNKLLDISQEDTLQIENDEDFSDGDNEKEDNENRGDKQNLPIVPKSQDNVKTTLEDKIEKPLRKPVFMNNHPRRRQNFGSQPETDDNIAFDYNPPKDRPEMNTTFEALDLRHRINAAKAATKEPNEEMTVTTKSKVDRLGIFNGADNAVQMGDDVKTVFTVRQETKPETVIKKDDDVIDLCDSDDDEIEMVAVVTNDRKKFKCIKLEDEEDNKKRINRNIVHATGTLLTDRIFQHYQDQAERLNSKTSLVNPRVLKGHIEHKKYEKYKRTIDDGSTAVIDVPSSPIKKPKFEPRVQVEITNFPEDWKENELEKVSNLVNAYSDDGEKAFEEIKETDDGKTLVVILKNPFYAHKIYESMNNRVLDECTIHVSVPHQKE